MKFFKLGIICLFLLLVSVGFVCAEDVNQTNTDSLEISDSNVQSDVISSKELKSDVLSENNNGNYGNLYSDFNLSGDEFNFTKNYKYDDSVDQVYSKGLLYDFRGTEFTINGNGFCIDGNNKANIFRFVNGTVTINNLIFKNSNSSSIILEECILKTNNVTFEGNTNATLGGAIFAQKSNYYSYNDKFINNYADKGSHIFGLNSVIFINSATFENSRKYEWSLIYGYHSIININDTVFNNLNSKYATVVYNTYITTILNSKFKNLHSDLTGGAVAVKGSDYLVIKDCEFINISSSNNGGAIFADVHGDELNPTGKVVIQNTLFDNCTSEFGAALLQLGGILELSSSTFNNNYAEGSGVVYLSNATSAIIQGNKFNRNKAYTGSALYLDNGVYTVNSNEFNSNLGYDDYEYGTIYIFDSLYTIVNASFIDSSNKDIHTFFDRKGSSISQTTANITKNDEIYPTYIQNNGTKIVLNPIKVNANATDSYFNLKDYNLVTPVKNQGSMGSCWAFGTTGAIESAFLMATNVTIILSENNMKGFNSRYSPYGTSITEGGYIGDGLAYALSWLGVINSTFEIYDELGKISSLKFPSGAYHMLEAVYINPNDTNAIKNALIKYGALTIFMNGESKDSAFYNSTTFSVYCNNASLGNHFVTIVGWNDTYSKENFNIVAPGDGAWICKNSWGENWGYDGYFYLSYYDAPLRTLNAIGYVINNTEIYNNLYQYDLSSYNQFYKSKGKSIAYANTYIAMGSEYISAVGTYFDDANVDYTVVIYINDNEVYYQKGKSAFSGYNLIQLEKYVTVNEGDNFTVEIQSNVVPLSTNARQIFKQGNSVVISNGIISDLSKEDCTACIKVYTMNHPSITKNIVQYYNSTNFIYLSDANGANCSIYYDGKAIANATVVDGKASFNIILASGKYAILIDYNGTQYINSIEILNTIAYLVNIKLSENAVVDYTAVFYNVNGSVFAKGSKVSYVLDGKKYDGTIGDNGTLIIKLNKLAKGKHTIYLSNLASGENVTTTIDVISRFSNVGNLNMYYFDGSTFKAYVYDDLAKPLSAGKAVAVYIKNKRYIAKTNAKGYISFKIPKDIVPGKYKIKVSYAGVTVTKTLKVKQVLKTSKFKVKKSAKKLVLKAVLKQGKKALKGKTILFKFNGKNYKAKTNKKGLAKVIVKKSAINKLRAGKTYPLKVTYLKDTIKSTVKVRR